MRELAGAAEERKMQVKWGRKVLEAQACRMENGSGFPRASGKAETG